MPQQSNRQGEVGGAELAGVGDMLYSSAISEASLRRFWGSVEKLGNESGCWLWTAYVDVNGYGKIGWRRPKIGLAHRAAFLIRNGQLEPHWQVLHKCDTPSCVNPDHLFLGDTLANMTDMKLKGRAAKGETSGHHKLTEAEVREIREAYALGEETTNLVKKFGVSRQNILHIVQRKGWNHLPLRDSEICRETEKRTPKGEKHGRSKLKADQVREIRYLGTTGVSQTEIASRFGISRRNVGVIISRRIWDHIK